MKSVYVPWLHMHQPLIWKGDKLTGNLEKMLTTQDQGEKWNAELIARAYKNPAKYVQELRKKGQKAKIMLDFSGVLLEDLENIKKYLEKIQVDGEKIGNIIKLYKNILDRYPDSIEFSGTAYSHCYFPVTPKDDWGYQIEEWRNTFEKLFGKKHLENVKGFWLPEMGIPGEEEKLSLLIKLLKDFGYEWIILPIEAVENEKQMSHEQRIIMTSQPHFIRVKNESIPVIFRARYDFIDQQAGCDANQVYEKCLKAGDIFGKVSDKPALIVPASDGENGNVMMNQFFPESFTPFFRNKVDDQVSSMTVSEFLECYYPKIDSEVKIGITGSSWIGSHKSWEEGDERIKINEKISELSERFHKMESNLGTIKDKKILSFYKDVKYSLLISETSCYTYWGTEFWFEQAKKSLKLLEEKINEMSCLLDRKLYFKSK